MKRRVMIVEDEMLVQLHLTRLMGELGHEVVGTAMNTREALAIAEREKPELVLMDIHLADGDDGVETSRRLVSSLDCAVVFITAYADAATIERSTQVCASGYLVKPFTAPAVRAAVSTALAGRRRPSPAREEARTMSSLLAAFGRALVMCDSSGRITFVSRGATELTGWTAAEAEGRTLSEVVRLADEAERRHMEESVSRIRCGEARNALPRVGLVRRDGEERVVDVELMTLEDQDEDRAGGAGRVLVSLRDRSISAGARNVPRGTRGRFGAGTRVLVYSHDTFGLGHLRRCLAIIRHLCADHPEASVLLVTGSPLVHRYSLPRGADYVKLPALRKVESEQYDARSLRITSAEVRRMRANLILHTVQDFDPNVLLVDHSPIGSKGELLPALDWLTERGGCVRILGLRDIVDEPSVVVGTWREQGVYGILRTHYDHVVVYGQRDVYDPVARYAFGEELAAKTRFVNYVCDVTDPPLEEEDDDGQPVVAVSIGGGDGGADTLLLPFLDMMRRHRENVDFRAEILPGPLLPDELEARIASAAAGLPVRVRSFVPSTARIFARAEAVVSTAGYNTSVDLLRSARGAVLVPRVLYRQEQLMRARRFAELGLVTCVTPEEARTDLLFEAIQRARREAPLLHARAEPRILLDGAERLSRFCSELVVEARSATA